MMASCVKKAGRGLLVHGFSVADLAGWYNVG